MRAAVIALALALVAGCSDPDHFQLHLSWSADAGRQICPMTASNEYSCSAIAVSCDAVVRLRVVDDADDSIVYYTECFSLPASGDLCGLGDLRIPAGVEIPNTMVRIQLQVWSLDQLRAPGAAADSVPDCPLTPGFDQRGLPLLDEPTPAVGGEIYFPVGDATVANLELGCPDYDQLDTQECRNRAITIDAAVLVPGSWRSVDFTEASRLDVRFGAPVRGDDGLWRLLPGNLTELTPTTEGELRWRASIPGPVDGLRCLHVLETVAMATPVATCQIAAVLPSAALPMTGFFMDAQTVNAVAALATSLTPGGIYPIEGIVVGLVVDEENHAKAGVVVAPSAGHVEYLNHNLTGFVSGQTDDNGLFMSLDTPLGTSWAAAGAGYVADGTTTGGLIADHITVVVVRMRSISASQP